MVNHHEYGIIQGDNMIIKCDNCGNKFNKSKSHVERAKHNYCKKECWLTVDHSYNKDFFSVIDTEEKAYWLGFICADGYVNDRDNMVSIGISPKDRNHLEKFSNLFNVPIYEYNYGIMSHNVRSSVYSKTIHNSLTAMGVIQNKSFTDMSKVFDFIPKVLYSHFIRGYFDGDGSIYLVENSEGKRNLKRVSILGNNKFLLTIKNILEENDIEGININTDRSVYVLTINKQKEVDKFSLFLYSSSKCYLERKKERFNK